MDSPGNLSKSEVQAKPHRHVTPKEDQMNFAMRPEHQELLDRVAAMIRDEVMPLEAEYQAEIGKGDRWEYTPRQTEILEGLKQKAKDAGLWNFWLTDSDKGFGLSTVEYAYFAEEMGKTPLGAETFNCSAPDTGNMEVFERYGT
jgi:acyl-CoA dehydrogenase